MPAATTHVEFARDVFNALPAEMQRSVTDLPMYFLGSQGPDLFFFHRFSILPGSLSRVGTRMHREHIADTISFLREAAQKSPALFSYYEGYLTHYALDSLCHPLIEWYAERAHTERGVPAGEAHFRYEGDLDQYVLKSRHHDYSVYRDLKVSATDADALGAMYHDLLRQVFQLDIPAKKLAEAPRDCALETRMLKPGALKYAMVARGETLLGQPHMVSAMMLWNKSDRPDVLNLDHSLFRGPDESLPSDTRSFPQLYHEAALKAVRLMKEPQPQDLALDFLGRSVNY
jgi:hypothetical protein